MALFDRTAQIDDHIIGTILSLRVSEAAFDDLLEAGRSRRQRNWLNMRPRHAPQGIIEGLACSEAIG